MKEDDERMVPFGVTISHAAAERIREEARRERKDIGQVVEALSELIPFKGRLKYGAPRRWWEFWKPRVTRADLVNDLAMKFLPISQWEKDQEAE